MNRLRGLTADVTVISIKKEIDMPEPPTCCLCGQPCEPWPGPAASDGYGHNPEPLAEWPARCCDTCNADKVIPARLRSITSALSEGRDRNHKENN